ncbi:MAG TPA: diguanylate cyclase [Terriglobales bacterium]|nr:diguanylate cyclase [Terriglobales bacterium]
MSDIAKRLEKAEKFLHKGKPESALDEYLAILEDDPRNDSVRQSAADLCLTLGRNDEAARLVSEMFDHYVSIGDIGKLVVTYKRLARLCTPSTQQTLQFAQFSEKVNRKDAVDAYEAGIKGLLGAQRKREALAALQRVVVLNPSTTSQQRLGQLAAELGENKIASVAFVAVAVAAERAAEDPSRAYARAYELDPQNAAAVLGHGRCLVENNHSEDAAQLLEPLANYPSAPVEAREAYGKALVGCNRLAEAEPYVWEMFDRAPKQYSPLIYNFIGAFLDADDGEQACRVADRMDSFHRKAGTRREFVHKISEIAEQHPVDVSFLEYLVELFNSSNREHEYCATLLRLFDIYCHSENFSKAADALDRAAEVDPYEPGHAKRLEMLREKIPATRFNAISNRFAGVLKAEEKEETVTVGDSESTVLEDLMLQAEIFLQYSMRSKALDRLDRISKLFPREEESNAKLRDIYQTAGYTPQYSETQGRLASAQSAPAGRSLMVELPVLTRGPRPISNEAAVDNISRVSEITRNLYRQHNVKGVLFTSVNDIGRHWGASRCVAGLISPSKPPSAAMEYCAPGIKQSEVTSIVKLITTLQTVCVANGGAVAYTDVNGVAELEPIQPIITSLNIQGLLAVSLMDGEKHAGLLILEQCGTSRHWLPTDTVVLRTIADQMVLAVNNARLRSLVKNLAVTDEKTGLLKRSSYLDVLLSEVRRSVQQNSPLSVMLMDFGKASALVREMGENGVEGMMQQLGQTIASHIRQNDVAVRYDLTEIALILADTSDKKAFFVVDKMRKLLEGMRFTTRIAPLRTTVGIAEAVLDPAYDPVDIVTEVINRAESSLHAAKHDGGNVARALAPAFANAS